MKIGQSKVAKWRALQDDGDINEIAAQTEKSRFTISRAFNQRVATEEVITAIDTFYEKRMKRLKIRATDLDTIN